MTRLVTLWVDVAPDPRLSSNDRGNLSHWARAELVKAEQTRALRLLKGQCEDEPVFSTPVSIAYKLRLARSPTGRASNRDVDNISGACKVWQDVLTIGRRGQPGLGLLVDDGPKWVRRVSYEIDLSAGPEYCAIEIEEME